MPQGIEWIYPDRSHRKALQAFTCTSPQQYRLRSRRREKYHARPWEFEVQGYVRGLKPPLGDLRRAILGVEGNNLASVAVVRRVESWFYYIEVVAVSSEHQGRGIGTSTLRAVMDEAALWGAELGHDAVTVEGFVHASNRGSHRMCSTGGLIRAEAEDSGELLCYQVELLAPDLRS